MFVLGHVGIGTRLLASARERLPARWLILGCLLPDLVDKPLFYLLLWARGHADPVIAGSRSVGHTGVFLLALLVGALLSRRSEAWALCAGVATHLALDVVGELVTGATPDSSIWLAIFYPAYDGRFPKTHFGSLLEHLRLTAESLYVIAGEIIGGLILLHAAWTRRRRQSS